MSDDDWDDGDTALNNQKAQAALQEYISSGGSRNSSRGGAGGGGPPSNRFRGNGKEHLVFVIGSQDIGRLIGRAGSTIKGLRSETRCQVYLPLKSK